MASILSARVRFLLAEGRGRRGEYAGVLSWLRGGSSQRRFDGGVQLRSRTWRWRLGFLQGEEKEGEEEQVVAGGLFILQEGGQA